MADEKIAKLFMNGRSQAVRLPKEFRFEGDRVRIRREGNKVILEPVENSGWPAGYWERLRELGPVSEEFEAAVREKLPESSYRDRVIDEWVEWANKKDARDSAGALEDGTNDVGGRPSSEG